MCSGNGISKQVMQTIIILAQGKMIGALLCLILPESNSKAHFTVQGESTFIKAG
jgi:hypothetical protein